MLAEVRFIPFLVASERLKSVQSRWRSVGGEIFVWNLVLESVFGMPQKQECLWIYLQHTNTHTGARPFACDFCPDRFAYSAFLYRHKLSHKRKLQTQMSPVYWGKQPFILSFVRNVCFCQIDWEESGCGVCCPNLKQPCDVEADNIALFPGHCDLDLRIWFCVVRILFGSKMDYG